MNSKLFDLTYLSTVSPLTSPPHEIGKISVVKKFNIKLDFLIITIIKNLYFIVHNS